MSGVAIIAYSGQGFSPRGEKGRYVLPPAFRKAVTESSDGRVLCIASHERWKCLTGFGLSRKQALYDEIDREEERALRLGRDFDREMRQHQLFGFTEVPFDASGRFILPDHLGELAGLSDALYFQGAGTFFTLWNPEELYRMGEGWEGAQAACRKLAAEMKGRKG
jgi:MraZ protein